ncbi:hypothetical protein OG851_12830 [Streptomyces sp. NBC_00161]|uniref:hypothetical protein n=1 Tax=Streptomyces sp. NBC_00161 TaxID=2975671 RepID=UPI00324358FA
MPLSYNLPGTKGELIAMTRYIEVLADAGGEADGQQQEEARAELVAALEELDVDEVRVRERPAPPGSKSGGLTTC